MIRYPFLILFYTIILSSFACKNTDHHFNKNSKIYGCDLISDSLVILDISNFKNFKNLYKSVENISCSEGVACVALDTNDNSSILKFSNPCWQNTSCIHVTRNNIFQIIDDSIIFEKKYPMDSLQILLQKHYKNEGKLPQFSDDPDKVIVSIRYESLSLSNLKPILSEITNAYDGIENSECLMVWLDGSKLKE